MKTKTFVTLVGRGITACLFLWAGLAGAATPMVSSGGAHTCAVLANGSVQCWGSNRYGGLGVGDSRELSTVPVTVRGITNAQTVVAGGSASCAVLTGGALMCWGYNNQGQLGVGSIVDMAAPVVVPDLTPVASVSMGIYHTCAALVSGQVACWGLNEHGQLGVGDKVNRLSPAIVPGINNAVKVAAGASTTCALLADATVTCWGDGRNSPNGGTDDATLPVAVAGVLGAVDLSSGLIANFTCALLANGGTPCWGSRAGGYYQADAALLTQISVNGNYNCVVLNTGSVKCIGANESGQLGDGTYIYPSAPVTVTGINNAVSVSAGATYACAMLNDGAIKCWGRNRDGQLGNGTRSPEDPPDPGSSGLPTVDTRVAPPPTNVLGFGPDGKADQIFWWAELANPTIFAPAGQASIATTGYRYRAYNNGHFLGVNQAGAAHLYYLGPMSDNALLDLNLLSFWLALSQP